MNSFLGFLQFGIWELGQNGSQAIRGSFVAQAKPTVGLKTTGGVGRHFTSVLGRIQLGTWQLGQANPTAISAGAFVVKANPGAVATVLGGVARPFTSVLGTIRLGNFQLGQVPAGSVTGGETFGKGSFLARAFPAASTAALPPTGSFIASAFPVTKAGGNKGPLLVIFRVFPEALAEGIFYYAEGAFSCAPDPVSEVQGVRAGAVVFSPFPVVKGRSGRGPAG